MKNRKQERDISLIEGDYGKTLNGIFSEIFTDLAVGMVHTPLFEETKEKILAYHKKLHEDNREKHNAYYRKKRLDRIDAIFEFFGYSVDVLDRVNYPPLK